MQIENIDLPDFKILGYRQQKLNKKELIKSTAMDMVQKSGLANFSMKKLCHDLEMAQSGIFYYYPTLPDLFFDLAINQLKMETDILLPYIQNTKQTKRAVKRYFLYFIQYYLQNLELFKMTYHNGHLDNLSDDRKAFFSEQSFIITSYLSKVCSASENEPNDIQTQLKLIKLSAINLITFYIKNLTEAEKLNFEDLVSFQWDIQSKMMF